MQVQTVPLARVIPYARNPRRSHDVDRIAASIREFGFQQPIVVDAKWVIIVGHGRYEAAKRLQLAEVPVVVADQLTPAQAKAYRLMDNRAAEGAGWDDELLPMEFEDLMGEGYDLALAGFNPDEVAHLGVGDDGESDLSDVWPKIALRIPPDVKQRFDDLMAKAPAAEDWQRFDRVLAAVDPEQIDQP